MWENNGEVESKGEGTRGTPSKTSNQQELIQRVFWDGNALGLGFFLNKKQVFLSEPRKVFQFQAKEFEK